MKKEGRILVVDDNLGIRKTLGLILPRHFEEVKCVQSPDLLPGIIREFRPNVVLLDMNFKSSINSGNEGLFWLKEVKRHNPEIEVVLFTAYGDIQLAVEGMKKGAFDFIVKPWENDNLIETLKNGVSKFQGSKTNDTINKEIFHGKTGKIGEIEDVVSKIAPTEISVLVLGENGTGKDVYAMEIHNNSNRRNMPFVAVDMGSLSETLFESELFGHVKGAFTGAISDHKGKFEQAQGGTLFLDEIGNIPLNLQAKLLRAIQNRVITKVGGNREIPIDIRIISATNKNIKEEVEKGRFREDLYYRLSGYKLEIPPLRERKGDILPIAVYFLKEFNEKYQKELEDFEPAAQEFLLTQKWPGNIRELKHLIEKAVVFAEGKTVTLSSLLTGISPHKTIVDEKTEKALIVETLDKTGRNVSAAAKILGMSRPTLYSKINKYNL